MYGNRKWKQICLLVIPSLAVLVFALVAGVRVNPENRQRFDNLREGMSIDEASAVLGRDVRMALRISNSHYTLSLFDCEVDMGGSVIPGDKIVLCFSGSSGRLQLYIKERHELTFNEFWRELYDRNKQYIGL